MAERGAPGTRSYTIPRPSSVLLHSRALLIAVLAVGAGLATAAATAHKTLLIVDEPISEFVRDDAGIGLFQDVTRLGASALGITLSLFAAAVLWPRCRFFAVVFPTAVVAAIITDVVLKIAVDRPRPPFPDTGTALGSFPSGHALRAVVLFGLVPPAIYVLDRSLRAFWASVCAGGLAVIATMVSRVYLGAHWPTDVLASALIGAVLLLVAEYVLASPAAWRWCAGCPLHRREVVSAAAVAQGASGGSATDTTTAPEASGSPG
jgi:membrane-associated phospholipid phosphatase